MKEPANKVKGLTILLTLKGRNLHTLRWLWHANRICLPFHVIVADGEVHPTIDRLMSNPETFSNLSFEYLRYEDKSFRDFYYKCTDALDKVKTPYVMISDNDDFLFPYGLQKSMAFLDEAPEYVCAGGGIPGFSLATEVNHISNVSGPLKSIKYRCILNEWYRCRNIDNASVATRVLEETRNPLSVYYNIYRTSALKTINNEIFECDISFRLHEIYHALRTVTLGKVRSDPSFFTYLRQDGTSMNFGSNTEWIDELFRCRFAQDLEAMVTRMACEAAKSDGCNQSEIQDQIHEFYTAHLKQAIASTLISSRFPRLVSFKRRISSLPRPRLSSVFFRQKPDQEKIWKLLAADGADKDTITAHQKELKDIIHTLKGDEFVSFVSQNAKELLV
ncbi:MAG: TIGR00180 family glycosyltransferase [Nitrospirae bacterium]|nr:MAG: TIGR00180 family glycosyltransferase [Nitrospirota bacterium]